MPWPPRIMWPNFIEMKIIVLSGDVSLVTLVTDIGVASGNIIPPRFFCSDQTQTFSHCPPVSGEVQQL